MFKNNDRYCSGISNRSLTGLCSQAEDCEISVRIGGGQELSSVDGPKPMSGGAVRAVFERIELLCRHNFGGISFIMD
jgi:hypothetical protein